MDKSKPNPEVIRKRLDAIGHAKKYGPEIVEEAYRAGINKKEIMKRTGYHFNTIVRYIDKVEKRRWWEQRSKTE